MKPVVDLKIAISVYKMCKSLFLNRRKTIYNNLKSYLGDSDKANKLLDELGLQQNLRPENISPKIYLMMYQKIQSRL